ncbi:MAG: hypothetical protein IID33_13970 [Planctomycetes bacterium]|nr:hypothetical protein [Planctomycetota bacterium]
MTIDAASERERLSQAKLLAWINRDMPATEMVTVCWSDRNAGHEYGIYCGLIPTARIEESLGDPCWDLTHGRGLPGATQFTDDDGNAGTEYLRYGDWHIEPLVIDRDFHGMRPDYTEISEEFRLFHRLYDDREQNHFIKFDDDGNEILVATIEPNRVQVRLKELRQFLAIKEMHLAIQFDCREHSTHSLENLGLKEGGNDSRDGLLCWGLNYGDGRGSSSYQSFSRLLGKRLIPPLPKDKSGFWPYAVEELKQRVEFIIGSSGKNGMR